MKKSLKFLLIVLALILVSAVPVSAIIPYKTFTYSYSGYSQYSPAAYVPYEILTTERMGLPEGVVIDNPSDIFVDAYLNIYVVCPNSNMIIKLDKNYQYVTTFQTFTNEQGVPDSLDGCMGVFVKSNGATDVLDEDGNVVEQGYVYVADTNSNRIVVFDMQGNFVRIVPEPVSEVFEDDAIYKPVALAVDNAGRIYVVSSTTFMGIISLDKDGDFLGFVGAQKVAIDAFDILWRRLQTEAQKKSSDRYVPTEYNNITIDSDGFIYVTTSSIAEGDQQAAIVGKSRDSKFAPVKKLNISGIDVLVRSGFYPPSGELNVNWYTTQYVTLSGASKVIDVALGPNGTWSIIDEKRQRIYTYDENGNMLWAFGNTGSQEGTIQSIEAIFYHGTDLLVLDKTADNIQVFKRTKYGDLLATALQNQRDRKYDESINDWQEILKMNNNFDLAYIGIGRAYLRDGQYNEAMEYFEYAYETEGWSDAFQQNRKIIIEKYIWLIPIVIIIICVAISMFLKYANKVNLRGQTKTTKRTLWEELLYAFHVMFHPFDGFWDIKHEKRGSLRASLIILAITILAFMLNTLAQGYLVNPEGGSVHIFIEIISVALPLLLWAIGNWCLTTLFDGEGSFKDIFITASYSLAPLPFFIVLSTIFSNLLTKEEMSITNLFITIGYIWVGLLLFFGTMTVHDYTFGKGILTTLGSILAMAFIMFVAVLFSGLVMKIYTFIYNIVIEVSFRMQ